MTSRFTNCGARATNGPTTDTQSTTLAPLAGMTGAELFVYEADASEHGTPVELAAVRRDITRRALKPAADSVDR